MTTYSKLILGVAIPCVLSISTQGFAEEVTSPPMKSRAEIIADAKTYANDPRWADSSDSTNWAIKKKHCREGNFFKMGFNRAFDGRKRERGLEKIKKKCKKVDIVVDETAYFAGWDKGSLSYCTFSKGLRHGRGMTRPDWDICGPKNFVQYHKGWNAGENQSGVLAEYERYKESAASWKSKVTMLEDDIEYGTSNSGVTEDKLETLGYWKNSLKGRRKDMLKLEQNNPDIFNKEDFIAKNKLPWASNWRE